MGLDSILKGIMEGIPSVADWFFSGSVSQSYGYSDATLARLGLDQKSLTRVNLAAMLPKVVIVLALLLCAGCTVALGGAKVEERTYFVEPGDTVKIATDKPLPILASIINPATGKSEWQPGGQHNLAGFLALPESVYQAMRDAALKWLAFVAQHPEAAQLAPPAGPKEGR